MPGDDATEVSIDPRRALAALGYENVSGVDRVLGGWETLLWRFTTPDAREHSLRVYELPRVRDIAWRERVALDACADAGLPAPRIETAGEFEGLPALVMSWCPGKPLLSAIESRPWLTWRLGRLFGNAQARVHAVAPPGELLANAPGDWAARAGERHIALSEHVLSLRPSTSSLIHMDFHPLNLIVEGNTLTGIIDWSGAAAGDRRADLARTVATLIAAPIPPGPLSPLLNVARKLIIRAWRSGYEEMAGPMPDYRPFLAWAGATLLDEIESLIGRPGVWGSEKDVERFRGLVDVWAREAGIN